MSAPVPIKGRSRDEMAARAAKDIPDGTYVNLGIGMPELVAQHIPADREVILHTENGLLGMGPPPMGTAADPELINAGKKPVTALAGASYFHHGDSFSMIRGGHLDFCVLGALEVAANGDLANWSTGERNSIPAVGGAMDLVSGVKNVFVMTAHCTRDGTPKLVESCSFPITGRGAVSRIYTDLAVIDIGTEGFELVELAPGISFEDIAARTAAPICDNRPTRETGPAQAARPLGKAHG